MQEVYVIGHLNPDTDTVVSAMAMAAFLNAKNDGNMYTPARTGAFNTETAFIFEKFQLPEPVLLENAQEKPVYLVDHNERSQSIEGITSDSIVGVVDHHTFNFQSSNAIEITVRPWGSTCTIVSHLFKMEGMQIPEKLKPALLCAILSDTVILRSPTTTMHDRETVTELANDLGIDYQQLGMEMFTAKAQLEDKTPDQILHNDFKVFEMGTHTLGIGQIETPDLSLLENRIPDLLDIMKKQKDDNNYHTIMLMLTDIIQEGTQLLAVSEDIELIRVIFETSFQENVSAFIPGMMSRKKQVVPQLTQALS